MTDEIWGEKHLKALLRLPRYPQTLIEQEPWRAWLERRGGLREVYVYLRTCSLTQNEQELLDLILRHPGASVQLYCDRLCISRRTYANYLNSLCAILLLHLNAWTVSPMATTDSPTYRSNVPAPLTALIGAAEPLAAVLALLQQPAVRCITLTGPGGVGKTRLAIEVANKVQADFADGVHFIALEPISDPALLSVTIIRVLNVPHGDEPHLEALQTYLHAKRLLLVLDNLEHLSEVGATISALLQAAPGLKILNTSREILNMYGEHCFTVAPLAVPDPQTVVDIEARLAFPAIQLFIERARAVRREFAVTEQNVATVIEICQCLDGLPLAIELAAARIRTYSPEQLLAQLADNLAALRSSHQNRPARHQSLRNVIEWSYRLLASEHKMLLCYLSVFDHNWDLKAAQAVCACEEIQVSLEELVDKSLIQPVTVGADVRFFMLNTLREYALEQLRTIGILAAVGRRHASYYLEQAEIAEAANGTPDHPVWAAWLQSEHGNLQTALRWMLEHEEAGMALRLTGAVWRFWQVQGVLTEGRYWLARALALDTQSNDVSRLKALWGAGWLAASQSDMPAAETYFTEGLLLAQELVEPRWNALLQVGLGEVRRAQQHYAEARALFEASLAHFQTLDDREEIAWSLDQLCRLDLEQRDFVRAQQLAEESLALFRTLHHQWGIAWSLDHLGDAVWNQGQYQVAATLFEEALQHLQTLGSQWHIAWTLYKLTAVRLAQGELALASKALAESLQLHIKMENTLGMVACLGRTAMLAAMQGALSEAVQLCIATRTLHRSLALPLLAASYVDDLTHVLVTARARLDPSVCAEARALGKALTLPQALDRAKLLCATWSSPIHAPVRADCASL